MTFLILPDRDDSPLGSRDGEFSIDDDEIYRYIINIFPVTIVIYKRSINR